MPRHGGPCLWQTTRVDVSCRAPQCGRWHRLYHSGYDSRAGWDVPVCHRIAKLKSCTMPCEVGSSSECKEKYDTKRWMADGNNARERNETMEKGGGTREGALVKQYCPETQGAVITRAQQAKED